jgi:threonine dehydrogenase-like Zn-dependent dehydrogenase
MKALVFLGERRLEVQELPDPVPTTGSVVLQVLASGVCGSDVHGYQGSNGRRFPGQVMGHEAVGVVSATPDDRADLMGKVVTFTPVISCLTCNACLNLQDNRCVNRKLIGVHPDINGAFAEYVLVPISNLFPWNSESVKAGTLVEPLSVAWRALSELGAEKPERVLVLGAGTIGALVAVALKDRFRGAVDIYDPLGWKSEWLGQLDINSVSTSQNKASPFAEESSEGAYDVVVDCVGSTNSLKSSVESVAAGGRVHIVGMAAAVVDYPLQRAVSREVVLSTSYAYTRNQFAEAALSAERLEPTLLLMNPVTCTLDDAPEQIEALLEPGNRVAKLVICP